jgi:hypothetical protein
MYIRTKLLLILLAAALMIQACPKSTIVSSTHDMSFAGPLEGTILVVGVVGHQTARRIYEDSFVEGLVSTGARAIPSYRHGLDGVTPEGKELERIVTTSGASFILFTHLLSDKHSTETLRPLELGRVYVSTWDRIHGYHQTIYEYDWDEELTLDDSVIYIVTSLFDCSSGKKIWSARTRSHNLDDHLKKDDAQLEQLLLEDMQRNGLLN